jgi:putative NADH-flavin reductase
LSPSTFRAPASTIDACREPTKSLETASGALMKSIWRFSGVEDLLAVGGAAQLEVEDRDRHVRHGHADGAAGDGGLEVGQRLGDGRRGAGLGDHHVERRGPAAAL